MSARVFFEAARPRTLSAAVVPVLVGSAVAASRGSFRPDVFVAALAAALLIQIGANYANDVSDHLRGADTPDRLGPARATALGLVSPRSMTLAAALAFALAAMFGLYLVSIGGVPVLAVAYLTPLLGWALEVFPLAVFLVALTAPLAQKLGDTVSHQTGRDLNPALVGTSRLHLLFGLLLSGGLLLRF